MKTQYNNIFLFMEDVAKKYFAAIERLRINRLGFSSGNSGSIEADQHYIERVNFAYECLSEEEQKIINNEFFYQDYPNWWNGMYTKTAFEKLKKTAVQEFIVAFG